jgi:hypothetical protein
MRLQGWGNAGCCCSLQGNGLQTEDNKGINPFDLAWDNGYWRLGFTDNESWTPNKHKRLNEVTESVSFQIEEVITSAGSLECDDGHLIHRIVDICCVNLQMLITQFSSLVLYTVSTKVTNIEHLQAFRQEVVAFNCESVSMDRDNESSDLNRLLFS